MGRQLVYLRNSWAPEQTLEAIDESGRSDCQLTGKSEKFLAADELVINGVRYGNVKYVAALFGITDRTLYRWISLGIGPPRIKIGRLVLFNLDRLPAWLAQHEVEPPTPRDRRRRRV
jgi:predicted DNA-binding transcriptional regulator AlpA